MVIILSEASITLKKDENKKLKNDISTHVRASDSQIQSEKVTKLIIKHIDYRIIK